MSLQSFTRKIQDLSTEQGFQFVFHCDFSDDAYRTKFIPYEAAKKAGMFRFIDKGLDLTAGFIHKIPFNSAASDKSRPATVVDEKDVTKIANTGSDIAEDLAKRYGAMSAQWHKEHDQAFDRAQEDAKAHFDQCSVCNRWACEYCYDKQGRVCKEHSKTMSKSSSSSAKATNGSSPEVLMVVCPKCEKIVSAKKFCGECGAKLQPICPSCGKLADPNAKFCGECGAALSR